MLPDGHIPLDIYVDGLGIPRTQGTSVGSTRSEEHCQCGCCPSFFVSGPEVKTPPGHFMHHRQRK